MPAPATLNRDGTQTPACTAIPPPLRARRSKQSVTYIRMHKELALELSFLPSITASFNTLACTRRFLCHAHTHAVKPLGNWRCHAFVSHYPHCAIVARPPRTRTTCRTPYCAGWRRPQRQLSKCVTAKSGRELCSTPPNSQRFKAHTLPSHHNHHSHTDTSLSYYGLTSAHT